MALLFTGHLRQAVGLDARGINLGATLLRRQSGQVGDLALAPPSAQRGGLHTLAARQRADLSRLGSRVRGFQNAALVGVSEGAPHGASNDLRIVD